jgi:DNA-binding beta-propeller fold protein YncE
MDVGLQAGAGSSTSRRPKWLRTLWRRLVKPAELSLLVLMLSGLAMFDPLKLAWGIVSWGLILHIVAAIVLVPAILIPFWISHRGRLAVTRRPFMAWSGRALEIGLGVLLLSGLYLWLVGQNGTVTGALMHWLHLGLAVPLVLLVVVHAWKRSTIKLVVGVGSMAMVLMGMTTPAAQPTTPLRAVESRSLLLEAGGKRLLAANFDGGSVSRIDRATGQKLGEAVLGGNITSISVDPDDRLIAATDFSGDKVSFLDEDSLGIRRQFSIPGRPAGIVYDARNRLFWIAATEGNRLYGVAPDGAIKVNMATAESPRGLALMPDGRLLVSHAMIGAVSIYETTRLPLVRTKFIQLAVEQNPDQTVSQGLPRGLDRIAVSPDGKQAWLPHVLWNFDHPFQFQSTVFPAISVLSLKPGDEHEAVSQRKQLFKQINIIENGNLTRIVSNPADVAFSDDGSRAYVTMSGSEDLVVFDLSRALPIDSASKKAKTTEGAEAVQIFRHLPGENPRGIVVSGTDIYVQNAMGLDLSKLTTGGSGSFASVSVVSPHFARLVGTDPLAPALRRGERLFDLANTAQFPDAPMTGDNWMSCSSCHVDGFNFANRALFEATPVDKFHSAFTGHGSIQSLVAGDFVGDYIRMIEDTQGGMGTDTRFPTRRTDPAHPSPAVVAMMKDLHTYVTSPGNLPLLATWLRGKDAGASVDPAAWTNSAVCASCHSTIFKQWSNSMHHFMGQSDPYYVVLEDMAAKDAGEPFRAWCMGCHEPQALLSGETRTTGIARLFDHDGQGLYADLLTYAHALDEGTGCLFCHRVTKIEDSGGTVAANASVNVDPEDRPLLPGETSDFGPLRSFADQLIRARPEVHAQSMMQNIKDNNDLCAACHEEFAPGTGSFIVDTYAEWAASPFNAPNNPQRNRTCMDCHMHASVASIGTPVPGQSTDGGPMEANVVTHQFVGAQYHLVGLHDRGAQAESIALLRSAAKLSLQPAAKPDEVTVRVTNTGAGHDLPTGISDLREMWLAVTVTDATGKTVLTSGALAANGDLDPEAHMFVKVLAGLDAHSVEPMFWRYMRMKQDTRIPAGKFRDESYDLPPGTAYPVKIDAKLMFRTFPQQLTDLVRKRFPRMPAPQPVEMAHLDTVLAASSNSSPGQP